MKQYRWDRHFLQLCVDHARMSKDPSTRVGAVIVGPELVILASGFNGFPRGIADTDERLNDRDMKNKLVVHAEMNAALAAARIGVGLKGSIIYLAATDAASSKIWGGCPCTRCTVELIQAGISGVVTYPIKNTPSRWHDDILFARGLVEEAGITYREVSLDD